MSTVGRLVSHSSYAPASGTPLRAISPTQSPSLQASPPRYKSTGKHAVTSRCASKGYGRQLACGLVCAFEHDPDPHTHTHATATSHPNDRLCPLAAGSTYTRALVTRPIHTAHTAHSRRNYYPSIKKPSHQEICLAFCAMAGFLCHGRYFNYRKAAELS